MEDKYDLEKRFIDIIKTNDDFICAYIVEEDKDLNIIWIVIKEAIFESNIKYIKSEREFRKNNNCNVETIIFSECEIKEINEQLKYVSEYELIS